MKHMAWGAVALLGAASLAGCYSYAADAVNNHNYNTVQATPNFSVIKVGDSDQVIVRLVNDNNTGTITSYTISNVGSGISVHYVATYRPIYNSGTDTLVNTTDKDAQEYYVVGLALGRYSFKITPTSVNTGVSGTVNVLVGPKTLFAALSEHTGLPGDTVTVTAPAGLVFSQASAVTFGSGSAVTIVRRAADSTSITFVVGGGVTGPATVTLVSQLTAPNVAPVSLPTGDSLVTTPIPSPIPTTVSATTASFGTPITVTLGAGLRFLRNSTISVGQIAATIAQIVGPDSTTAIIFPAPGSNDSIAFTNVAFIGYHPVPALKTAADTISAGAFSGKGDKVLTVSAPANVATTVSNATPDIGVPVTVTLAGGFRFLGTSQVAVGGIQAGIQSVSADSSTATIVPMAGSAGAVTFTSLAPSGAPKATINLPSDGKTITVSAVYGGPTDPNVNATATAPTVTLHGASAVEFSDGGPGVECNASVDAGTGGSICHYFKLTLGATSPTTLLLWSHTSADMAVLLLKTDGTCIGVIADGLGVTDGAVGEANTAFSNCAESAAATWPGAGTYIVAIVRFTYGGANPTWVQARISNP